MIRAGILMALTVACRGEIIDRIAASVDNHVITERQVVESIRVAAFLNGMPPDFSGAQKRLATDRLVEQYLLRREMDFTRFNRPAETEVEPLLRQVTARFAGDAAYQAALRVAGITDAEVRQSLRWQLATLRFIDFRFRPSVQITPSDLRDYYRQQVETWKSKGVKSIPTFGAARADLEKTLAGERADQALDRWLGEARTQTRIVYHDEVFRDPVAPVSSRRAGGAGK